MSIQKSNFIVGVDYASDNDRTTIAHYLKNENGTYTLVETESSK
jgi:hypothetical protein